jgi:hypothetical protein
LGHDNKSEVTCVPWRSAWRIAQLTSAKTRVSMAAEVSGDGLTYLQHCDEQMRYVRPAGIEQYEVRHGTTVTRHIRGSNPAPRSRHASELIR